MNPVTEIDDNWHDGQVWIEALEPNINYWVIRPFFTIFEVFPKFCILFAFIDIP